MKIGSLFTGYGGLDLAVEQVFGGTTTWTSDVDPGACKIIAHRFPDAPNLGDVTRIDWANVDPVDVIAGGSPCQDVSTAGRRAGMTDGTRSNLWTAMREGIAHVRPRFVVWENVRGATSATATSAMESDPRLLGDHPTGQPVLRALGRVLGDLADLGYDTQWHGLRVSDLGGCHHRFRLFVVAYPRGEGLEGLHDPTRATQAGRHGHTVSGIGGPGVVLPTPTTSDTNGAGAHGAGGPDLRTAVAHLPTPTTTQRGTDANLETREGARANLHNAVMHLPTPLTTTATGVQELERVVGGRGAYLPTPSAADGNGGGRYGGPGHAQPLPGAVIQHADRWAQYAGAIASHAALVGRPAPDPTEPNTRGGKRLSPAFTEWMMGLPAGWITDVPGITRNEALKACGNGVVPQQAVAALTHMINNLEN